MENKLIFTQVPLEELKDIISNCVRDELNRSSEKSSAPDNELLKIEDAVKIFKVSKVTLFKWRKQGILPFHRISSRIYFKRHEVLDALKKSGKYKS